MNYYYYYLYIYLFWQEVHLKVQRRQTADQSCDCRGCTDKQ